MGSPDRVQVTGPLAAFNSGFAAELVRLGYRPNAAANQLQLMAHLSRWMTQRGLTADGLTASVLADFLAARRAAGYRLWLSPKALSPLVTYLRGLGVAPAEPEPEPGGAVETLLARYRGYLVRERGLSASTAGLYAHLTSPLLASRMVGGELDRPRLPRHLEAAARLRRRTNRQATILTRHPATRQQPVPNTGSPASNSNTSLRNSLRTVTIRVPSKPVASLPGTRAGAVIATPAHR
jgi:hypothetical protein